MPYPMREEGYRTVRCDRACPRAVEVEPHRTPWWETGWALVGVFLGGAAMGAALSMLLMVL